MHGGAGLGASRPGGDGPRDLPAHPHARDGSLAFAVGALALGVRLAFVIAAGAHFPPAADGVYYHRIAERIAAGLGATWLWPDGAVTYVAHYPVGYSALLAAGYVLAGASPVVGGVVNALLGACGAVAAYALARGAASRWAGLAAGALVALHPGLVLYTPALMTEGVTAALLATAAALAALSRRQGAPGMAGRWGLGLVLGAATLVRPQSILLAPCFGWLACPKATRPLTRAGRAALVTVVVVAITAPWAARNCVRMHRCGVSFNGGWNLLIGASDGSSGSWAPVDVPSECRTVWDEAAKDACFERAARRLIALRPLRWLALVPRKLAVTFDGAGVAGAYLHTSNPMLIDAPTSFALGVLETIYARLMYAGMLLAVALVPGPRRRARGLLAAGALVFILSLHAYIGVLLALSAVALLGRALFDLPVLHGATALVLAATVAVHALFFGSGRYAMVAFPLVAASAAVGLELAWANRRARARTAVGGFPQAPEPASNSPRL